MLVLACSVVLLAAMHRPSAVFEEYAALNPVLSRGNAETIFLPDALANEHRPDRKQRTIYRCHGVLDGWWIVECSTRSRLAPCFFPMLKPARRQDQVKFLRQMVVIGITHLRCEQRSPNGNVIPFLQTPFPHYYGIGVSIWPIVTRLRPARRPDFPGKQRRNLFKCRSEMRHLRRR
jgi:hypothetical protein